MPTKPPASFYTTQVALGADVATALYGVTGAGQDIGIISDSFNAKGGYATDVANGIAPANVDIVSDATTGSDEGRAMLELAYSIAPGASFSTAEGNPDGLSAEVTALQKAGATIIADDLSVGGEGLYQNGSATDVAISAAVAANVDYFTSAGNNGNSYYEQGFTPLATSVAGIGAVTANDFGNGSPYLSLTIENGSTINPIFQFGQPFGSFGTGANSPTNSLAIYLLDASGAVVASSTVNDVGVDPTQGFRFENTTSGTAFRLVVVQNGGTVPTGELFKLVLEDGGATINSPNAGQGSGDLLGHEMLPGLNSVGAVNQATAPANGGSPTVESFSSVGPGTELFDAQGNTLPSPVTVGEPQFEAPDATLVGSANTNFATSPFFGTSAAAPSAAAVGALVLQADPTLSTTQLTALLLQTVIPAASANPNVGAGLIQARAGVEIAAADAGDRWTDVAGGNWNNAASWSTGAAPTSAMAASLSDNLQAFTGAYTITVNTGGDTAGSIAISTPAGSSATLNVTTGGTLTIGPAGATNTAPTATDITSGDLLVSDNGTLTVTGGMIAETGSLNVNNGTVTVSLGTITANNYAQNAGLLTVGGGSGAANLMLTGTGFAETGGTAAILALGKLTAANVVDSAKLTIAGTVIDTGNLTNLASGADGIVVLQTGGELDIGGTDTKVDTTFAGNGLLTYTSTNTTALAAQASGVITGLAAGNGAIDFTGIAFNPADTIQYFTDNGQASVADQNGTFIATVYLNQAVDYTGKLALKADGTNHVELVSTVPCYCPGTHITTPLGEVAVENLVIGDVVVTADGLHEPIRWIGRRSYAGAFIAGQQLMLPVCFRRNSLADGVPHTDLWVSPGHAMFVEGQLIPAWRLVNGVSIQQAKAVEQVTYIHVELDRHAILLANGAQAESFLDDGCRGQFHNAQDFHARYPHAEAMKPFAPRLEDGFALHRLHKRLAARAGAQVAAVRPSALRGFVDMATPDRVCGWAQDEGHPDRPVALEVLVGGQPVLSLMANAYRADLHDAGLGTGCHAFDIALSEGLSGPVSIRRITTGELLGFTAAADTDRALAA